MCGFGQVTSAAGTVLSAVGAYQQGQSAGAVADYNADVQEIQARTTLREGSAEEQRIRRASVRQAGQQVAAIGASGLTSEGTPTDVMVDSAQQMELDALNTRYGARRSADNYRAGAAASRAQAGAARSAGIWGAATTLLGGANSWNERYGFDFSSPQGIGGNAYAPGFGSVPTPAPLPARRRGV